MAKRGRKPKQRTMADLAVENSELRARIDEAILSHGDVSAIGIFRRFGLEQWGLILGTFRKYVTDLRRANAGERTAQGAEFLADHRARTEEAMIAELRRRVLVAALDGLDAGSAKLYEIVSMLSRVQEFDRIGIERAAERRAGEKHAAWRDELQTKLDRQKKEADEKAARLLQSAGVDGRVVDAIQNLYGIRVAEDKDEGGRMKDETAVVAATAQDSTPDTRR